MAVAMAGTGVRGNVYDVSMPLYRPSCRHGCLPWSEVASSLAPSATLTQAAVNSLFIEGAAGSAAAGSDCAMPGASAGAHEKDCGLHCDPAGSDQWTRISDSFAGPWCFCKDPVAGVENSSQ